MNRLLMLSLSVTLLVSCGGSSGGSKNPRSNINPPTSPTTPTTPVTPTVPTVYEVVQESPSNNSSSYQVKLKLKNISSDDFLQWKFTALAPIDSTVNCWENGGSIRFSKVGQDIVIEQSLDLYHATFKANTERTITCQVDLTPWGRPSESFTELLLE